MRVGTGRFRHIAGVVSSLFGGVGQTDVKKSVWEHSSWDLAGNYFGMHITFPGAGRLVAGMSQAYQAPLGKNAQNMSGKKHKHQAH